MKEFSYFPAGRADALPVYFPIPAITRDPAYEQALGMNLSEIMRKITDLQVAALANSTDKARSPEQNTRPPHHPKMKILKHLE